MISTRRKPLSDPLQFLAFHNITVNSILANNPGLVPGHIYVLSAIHAWQAESNTMPDKTEITARSGYDQVSRLLLELGDMGYLNVANAPRGQRLIYNVTEKGEYLLRAYSIEMSRLMNDTPLSKWQRIKKGIGDMRERYLRRAARKGNKLY